MEQRILSQMDEAIGRCEAELEAVKAAKRALLGYERPGRKPGSKVKGKRRSPKYAEAARRGWQKRRAREAAQKLREAEQPTVADEQPQPPVPVFPLAP